MIYSSTRGIIGSWTGVTCLQDGRIVDDIIVDVFHPSGRVPDVIDSSNLGVGVVWVRMHISVCPCIQKRKVCIAKIPSYKRNVLHRYLHTIHTIHSRIYLSFLSILSRHALRLKLLVLRLVPFVEFGLVVCGNILPVLIVSKTPPYWDVLK